MNFQSFIEKHYLPQSADNLFTLLNDLEIKEQLTFYVDDYFNSTRLNTIEATIVQLSFTIYNFTETVNICLSKQENNKIELTQILAELGIRLIKETYKASNLPKDTYFNTLKQTLQKLYFKHNWNFEQLEEILNLAKLHNYSKEQKAAEQKTEIKTAKKVYFDWNNSNKKPFDFFINDVHKHCKIKNAKGNLYHLFSPTEVDFVIVVPSSHLELFIVLFKHLYAKDIIKVKGGKAYMQYLEKHVRPPKNDKHPKREFTKLCNEYLAEDNKKKSIETFINSILEE